VAGKTNTQAFDRTVKQTNASVRLQHDTIIATQRYNTIHDFEK